jgi:hypothetical protein
MNELKQFGTAAEIIIRRVRGRGERSKLFLIADLRDLHTLSKLPEVSGQAYGLYSAVRECYPAQSAGYCSAMVTASGLCEHVTDDQLLEVKTGDYRVLYLCARLMLEDHATGPDALATLGNLNRDRAQAKFDRITGKVKTPMNDRVNVTPSGNFDENIVETYDAGFDHWHMVTGASSRDSALERLGLALQEAPSAVSRALFRLPEEGGTDDLESFCSLLSLESSAVISIVYPDGLTREYRPKQGKSKGAN